MRILNNKQFLKITDPVLFRTYKPIANLGELKIKLQTLSWNEYGCKTLAAPDLKDYDNEFQLYTFLENPGRLAQVDNDTIEIKTASDGDLFLILDVEDVKGILKRLKKCVGK